MSANNIAGRPATLVLLLLLASSRVVQSDLFSEVGRLVEDRVSSFMSTTPAAILDQLKDARSNGVFADNLSAADRDAFLRMNAASMEAFPQFDGIYFGLEDGTFAAHTRNNGAYYREPGYSGYLIAGDDGSKVVENPAMEKYYKACINSTSGENLPCQMKAGKNYTECTAKAIHKAGDDAPLFDCVLKRCACESVGTDQCEENVKWCSSYDIKQAPDNVTLGYIPLSGYCIDRTGVPTQTRAIEGGGVAIEDQEEGGACYYSDKVTPVERSFEGDFAYCGGHGAVCNGTFYGAYMSTNFDPRWREWYTITKAIQRPNWSPPYIFFTVPPAPGTTFSVPIYTVQDDGRNVFAGVLGLDYTFDDIAEFLKVNFMKSTTIVAIF